MRKSPVQVRSVGKSAFSRFISFLFPRHQAFRKLLLLYDAVLYLLSAILLTVFGPMNFSEMLMPIAVGFITIFSLRSLTGVYGQIWRYGGIGAYVRLTVSDSFAFLLFAGLNRLLPISALPLIRVFAIAAATLLLSLSMRMAYYLTCRSCHENSVKGKMSRFLLRLVSGRKMQPGAEHKSENIGIAIVGAGRVGTNLAAELMSGTRSAHSVRFFIDTDAKKIGRYIGDIPILSEKEINAELLHQHGIQEIVFAFSEDNTERREELYNRYKDFGCRILVYDYPTFRTAAGGKRMLREFDIEELLFRKPVSFIEESTAAYYRGKTVLITGGGGSIGSELSRQIAAMYPKKLILLDVYENGAYEIQQELKSKYGSELDLSVEILSVCNYRALERIFDAYRPQIVLMAAAHKHVPLMEHNCCEAVENNVFGTKNTVDLAVKYHAERVLMVSTDKAVNPTNVMGATKRMCELVVQSRAQQSEGTVFCATRFGNVLGSAGSVIPLFKKQIARGGPVTITDKRIIRYFMTIPEASQLVLTSGAMAKNGELFVLDMGKPVKILDLAENLIRLSGYEPYIDIPIVETGLRPGEKLYEELLIRSEELSTTSNSMIFVEKDKPLPSEEIEKRLEHLRLAVEEGSNEGVKAALHEAVPTFRSAEIVNQDAEKSAEMNGKR